MEAAQTSRSPLGICTRNRSQIPIQIQPHRTRSSRFINSLLTGFGSDQKRPGPTDSSDGEDLHSLIKDIGFKLVFSPTYKPPESLIADTNSGARVCSAEPEFNSKETKRNPVEICGNRFDCSAPDLDDSNIKEPQKLGFGFLAQSTIPTEDLAAGSGSDPDSTQTSPPVEKGTGVELKIDSETKPVCTGMLDFCELPNLGKSLEEKSSEIKLVSEKRGTYMHQFTAQNVSRECPIVDSDTQPEVLRVSSNVLSNGDDSNSKSPECDLKSMPVADQCLLKSE